MQRSPYRLPSGSCLGLTRAGIHWTKGRPPTAYAPGCLQASTMITTSQTGVPARRVAGGQHQAEGDGQQ